MSCIQNQGFQTTPDCWKEKKRKILFTDVNVLGVDSSSDTQTMCMGHYEIKPPICKRIHANNKLENGLMHLYYVFQSFKRQSVSITQTFSTSIESSRGADMSCIQNHGFQTTQDLFTRGEQEIQTLIYYQMWIFSHVGPTLLKSPIDTWQELQMYIYDIH